MKERFPRDIVVGLLVIAMLILSAHTYMTTTNISTALFMQDGAKINFSATGAAAADVNLYRSAPKTLKTDDTFLAATSIESNGNIVIRGINGQQTTSSFATTELTGLSGASVTASSLIPAGSWIVGVTVRVTITITGATTFDIGDGTDVDRWGSAIALSLGTTTTIVDFTADGSGQFASANDVILTANGANFTAGAVRITVHIIATLTPPTT